ncbi:phosphoribosylanthranilate isomerase [Natronomonas sp. EA1]|uniref:phosphoribosylanthranilate isomerase n=1 Tax=Natronomonas sp. EA1 TaxID=3421655 RepID=UPI003EB9285E
MTRAKVCGLTREADVRAAVDAGADALGFIVDVPVDTPREISREQARSLIADVPPFVSTVAVTMPDAPEAALAVARETGADAIQLHTLPPADCAALRDAFAGPVIRAVDHEEAESFADAVDAVLVDSVDEAGAGGTGETHDWDRTRELVDRLSVPVVLAGGLTPENVTAAVETVDPYAVDVASGVERTGGEKDHDAVRAFVRAATHPEVVV